MSSYVSSAYLIEESRLNGIVSQCERELEAALEAVKEKRDKLRRSEKSFHDMKMAGKREQEGLDAVENIIRSSTQNDMYARCDWIERNYMEDIDTKIGAQLAVIRQHIASLDIQANVLFNMIDQCEKQIVENIRKKDIQRTENCMKDPEYAYEKSAVPVKKKGIDLSRLCKKGDKLTSNQNNDIELFEKQLQELKKTVSGKNAEILAAIENEYREQPDFAKKLYVQQMLPKMEEIYRDAQQKNEAKKALGDKIEKLKMKCEALAKLLGKAGLAGRTDLLYSEDASYKELRLQCEKMEKALLEKKKREYAYSAVRTVMERHGVVCCDTNYLSEGIHHYQFDENVDFCISGISQNRFIVEMNGKYGGRTPSLDDTRKSVASAKKACGFLKNIREELKQEYGVIFDDESIVDPSEKTIYMKKSFEESLGKEYRYSKQVKELALNNEG